MLSLYIGKVHYGNKKGVRSIESVKYTFSLNSQQFTECTKQEMIKKINSETEVMTKIFENNKWREGEIVRVVDNKYLRTDANNTKEDNLGNILEY